QAVRSALGDRQDSAVVVGLPDVGPHELDLGLVVGQGQQPDGAPVTRHVDKQRSQITLHKAGRVAAHDESRSAGGSLRRSQAGELVLEERLTRNRGRRRSGAQCVRNGVIRLSEGLAGGRILHHVRRRSKVHRLGKTAGKASQVGAFYYEAAGQFALHADIHV